MRFATMAATLVALGSNLANATTYKPSKLPAVPLAVRSPYLNAWLQCDNGECDLTNTYPKFWT